MYKTMFMKSLDENDLALKIDKFEETHYIVDRQYSICPYNTEIYHKVWHCVMLVYKEYKKSI